MNVRAKFTVVAVTEHDGTVAKTIELRPQYDTSIEEDRRFEQYTPNGLMQMTVTNAAVLDEMKVGKSYYVDFSPVGE